MLFLELSRFFDNLADVGNLISGSSAFSKTSLNIWKFTVHVFLKPGLENFEQYSTSVWDECSCAVVWTFIGIAFLWDWNEHWPFPILWPLQSFPDLLAYWAYCLIANLFSVLNKYSLVWCTTGYLCIHLLKYFLILPNFDDEGGLACCDSWGRKESDTTEATAAAAAVLTSLGCPFRI